MTEIIKVKANVSKKLFYNNSSSYGVYSFKPLQNDVNLDIDPKFNTFVVAGNTFELMEGKDYDLEIEETESKKYGKGYGFISVKLEQPISIEDQQEYIRSMINPAHAEAIIDKYPNEKIIDLFREDKIDYSDIKGIGKKKYERIKEILLDNLDIQNAIVSLKELNITYNSMKKLIEHYGSPELVVQKVNENIYSLCAVRSFSFKKVDEYAMNRGDSKTSKERIEACLSFLLDAEESNVGSCYMTIPTIIEKAKELLTIERSHIESAISNLDSKQFYIDETRIANMSTYRTELSIYKELQRLLKSKSKVNTNNVDDKIKQIEEEQGFEFTDEQRKAILMTIDNNVLVINGKGGTGKSTILKGIVKAFDQYNHVACALSGKASNVLVQNGLNGQTIHRTLGLGTGDNESHKTESGELEYQIVILDETSMVNGSLFNQLICSVGNGYKFIIVGDDGQLDAIGYSAVFRDLLRNGDIPRIELTKVHRQAAKSGILSAANEIREGNQILKSNQYGSTKFGELKDHLVYSVNDRDSVKDLTLNISKKFIGKNLLDFQVITGRKSGGGLSVKELNIELQQMFNPNYSSDLKLLSNGYTYYIGDKVIQTGNNYNAKNQYGDELTVFNGTIGIIKDIRIGTDEDTGKPVNLVHIDFEGVKDRVVYSEVSGDMNKVELAYAITVHRSQGSTIKHIIFAFDYASYKLLSRGFAYTGITRASKGAVTICELNALRHAIKTDASNTRKTFLCEFLSGKM